MEILRGYGMGQNMARLINYHCDNQEFVPNEFRFLGKYFGIGRGVTQGDPAYSMLFNIVLDVMVREVLKVVCG